MADRSTMERVLTIEQKIFPESRVREATEKDWERVRNENLRYVELNPECRDWWLNSSFDGESWPRVYRDTSLAGILRIAEEKADGRCIIFFRPATPEEIRADDEDQAEYFRE